MTDHPSFEMSAAPADRAGTGVAPPSSVSATPIVCVIVSALTVGAALGFLAGAWLS